jgi:hypothetical protein
MGVDYTAYMIYGIEYAFYELEHIKENFQQLIENIGCDNLHNLLSEAYSDAFISFISNDNYVDEDEQTYYFGIILTERILMRNPSYSTFDDIIKTECKKLDIKFKDPEFHNVVAKN